MNVGITKQFLDSYYRLNNVVQKKTFETLETFGTDERRAGTKLEKLKRSASGNTYSIRVDQSNRIILGKTDSADGFIALYVSAHDDAYDWAESHKFEKNPSTGLLQIFRTIETEVEIESESKESDSVTPLLGHLNDEDLYKLSVPMEWVPKVLSLTVQSELDELEGSLPTDTFEALSLIVAGESFEEVLDLLQFHPQEKQDSESDIDDPFKVVGRDIHVASSIGDLEQILQQPLGHWRLFLHPSQEKVVRTNWKGPTRITGGPGTGKTVCALHRVKEILESEPTAYIMVTSYDRFLTLDLRSLLSGMCSHDELDRIETISIDEWTSKCLKEMGINLNVVGFSQDRYFDIWNGLRNKYQSDFSVEFLSEEYDLIILEKSVHSLSDYMRVKRVGRGTRLTGSQRQEVYSIFEEFSLVTQDRGSIFAPQAYDIVSEALRDKKIVSEFTHVVVDEMQDFGSPALKLLSHVVPGSSPNLFMVGDLNQRIRSMKSSFSSLGIHIKGRSRTLKINYRTSRSVFEKATSVRFKTATESEESLYGTASLFQGNDPTIKCFNDWDEEFEEFFEWLTKERQQFSDDEICVVTRTTSQLQKVQTALKSREVTTYQIRGNVFDHTAIEGIRISTIHRIKGLEFSSVAVLGANYESVPLKRLVDRCSDGETREEIILREINAFFVAMTRTKGNLWISGSPTISSLLT